MQLRPFHAALALTLLSSTAAAQASNSLDAATRRTIIEAAIAQLDTNYVWGSLRMFECLQGKRSTLPFA